MLLNYSNLIDPLLENMRTVAAGFVGMKAGDRVLDVCCGTGAQVFEYARNGLDAVGIDIDPAMLHFAFEKQSKLQLDNAAFTLADAGDLPFADDFFDFASIEFALHDKLPEIRAGIVPEMMRVVKPGGGLVFIDFRVPLPKNLAGTAARIIEFLADGTHYRGFRHYTGSGGLPVILANHRIVPEKRIVLFNGLIEVVKSVNSPY